MIRPGRWLRTIRHMQGRQVFWRLRHGLRRVLDRCFGVRLKKQDRPEPSLAVPAPPWCAEDFPRRNHFFLLNREKDFAAAIDWKFADFGPLWHYRLNAFDWLCEKNTEAARALDFMENFLEKLRKNPRAMEPWPLSRRIINWIRMLEQAGIDPARRRHLAMAVFAQARRLARYPEYHLPGNHLIENGLALLWAGAWLGHADFSALGERILKKQLALQVLDDGGHVERSSMYHCQILAGLLDALDLARRNPDRVISAALREQIAVCAASMLGWVEAMIFSDNQLPCVNDSAAGAFPQPEWLRRRAATLGVAATPVNLGTSGYFRLQATGISALVDAGPLGPDANPGHGHCDTLSVQVFAAGKPLLVDPGTSSYHDPEIRLGERGTAAHNTVMAAGMEQSEIWGAFRVGRRARVHDLEQNPSGLSAAHDGYRTIGLHHQRRVEISPRRLVIRDRVDGRPGRPCAAFFHFHPAIEPRVENAGAEWPGGRMTWVNGRGCRLNGWVSAGFNRRIPAAVVRVDFLSGLELVTRLEVFP